MTFCLGINLAGGLIGIADTRVVTGTERITARKLWTSPDPRQPIFLMSSGNYVERAIAGLKPDVALIAPLFSNNTFDFTPRLVRALNYPKLVLPTHWDNFEAPLTGAPTDLRAIYGDPANLDVWVKEMKKVKPRTKIVTMPYVGSFAP